MQDIIIVGCGRVGSQLAMSLAEDGNNVCVIDKNSNTFANLGQDFSGSTVQGEGFDRDTLLQAGIEHCDVLCSVTEFDNTNLMIAEVARHIYKVGKVITRLYSPDRQATYRALGIEYVCGTSLVADEIYSRLSAEHSGHLQTFGDYELLQFRITLAKLNRRSIRVAEIEREHGIRVVAFDRRDHSVNSIPAKDTVLYDGDSVLVCVRHGMLDSIAGIMQG